MNVRTRRLERLPAVTAYRLASEVTNVSRAVTSAPEASSLRISNRSHDDAVAVERPLAKNAAIVGNAIAATPNRNRSSLNGERPRRKGRSRARVDEQLWPARSSG